MLTTMNEILLYSPKDQNLKFTLIFKINLYLSGISKEIVNTSVTLQHLVTNFFPDTDVADILHIKTFCNIKNKNNVDFFKKYCLNPEGSSPNFTSNVKRI